MNNKKKTISPVHTRLRHLHVLLAFSALLPLLPWIIRQGKHVRKTALRLPEASGPRSGRLQDKPSVQPLTLFHIGESTVAGVGAETIDQGLTHALVSASETLTGWTIEGHNGWKACDFSAGNLPELSEPGEPYVLLITLGVNDTTGFTSLKRWRDDLDALVSRCPNAQAVFFTQVPDMAQFPALPAPLRNFLGLRATQLNLVLQTHCARRGWHWLQSQAQVPADWMAADGYHPNASGYREWGIVLADAIDPILKRSLPLRSRQKTR
ncbi:SGNH/GDSL hydrolase family protein [Thalassolituus sp. LLYu03]|uniref:SGNH/GDSL hydrolase family protein n=1 Tax=Thalassolituus sp. LLYu03 TaxID=3421656 RepID=UPI003D2961EE